MNHQTRTAFAHYDRPRQQCIGLLAFDEAHLLQHDRDLAGFGFTVLPCRDVAALCAAARNEPLAAAALAIPLLDQHLVIAQLRVANPRTHIIAMADFPDRQSRIATLLSGADACVEQAPDAMEVAAVLLALQRRNGDHGAQPAPDNARYGAPHSRRAGSGTGYATAAPYAGRQDKAYAKWRLMDKGWTLASPDDVHLPLTSAERQVMLALIASPSRTIDRGAPPLPAVVAGRLGHDPIRARRYLDVIVSRLRRKAAERCMDLPIRSVRGKGYCFVGEYLEPDARL